jgi:3-oxoadipate enol-lactonase
MPGDELIPQRSGHVDIENKKLYWEFFGAGDREVVCLLNGLAMSTHAWYAFLPKLSPEFDVLLFDYWGQGRSFSEDEPYSIPSFCHGLAAIAEELAIKRLHMMGISYGGFIGLDFARLYQDRLHTLTLSGILLSHEAQFQMYEDISLLFYRSRQMELYAWYLYEKIFGEEFLRNIGPQLEVMRQKLIERYGKRPFCLERLTLAQHQFFSDLDANLSGYRSVHTPTLVLAGEYDRVIAPHVQRKMCTILANAQFELIPNSGHCVHLEQPDPFFRRLTAFMTTKSFQARPASAVG